MDASPPYKQRFRQLGLAVVTTSLLLSGCGNNEEADAAQADIHIASSQAYRDQGQYRAAMIEARNAVQLQPNDVGAALTLADIYLELGDGKAAAELLQKVAGKAPGETALPLAQAYLDQGKYRSASDALATPALAEEQRQSLDYLVAKAQIAAHDERIEEAENLLREAIDQYPGQSEAGVALVELTLQHHGPEAAARIADEVLERHQNRPDAQFALANVAIARNDSSAAERYLTEALSRLPRTDVLIPLKARVLDRLSGVLTQQGRTTEALVYKRLLAEANPDAIEMRQQYNDAITQFQAGNLNEAEATLTELYDDSRGNDASALFLGLVNLRKGELDQAVELFDQHLDTETASPEMIRAASLAKLQKNQPEEALQILREALENRPNDANVQAVFGLTALGIPGAEEEGAIALQKAIAQDPDKVNLRLALADHYFRLQQPEQALAQLKTAADAAPGNFAVQRAYVTTLLRRDDVSTARSVTNQLQKTLEDESFVWLLSAQTSLVAEDYPAALQQLSKAAALAPREPAPLLGLAQLALQQREWANAARYFERAADLRGDLDEAYKGIITAHESAGTVDQGLARLQEMAQDGDKAATVNSVLAHYYLLNRQLDKARQFAGAALAASDTDSRYVRGVAAQVYRRAAGAARGADQFDQARSLLLEALELIPNSLILTSDLAALEIDAGQFDEAERILDKMEAGATGKTAAVLLRANLLTRQNKQQEALDLLERAWSQKPDANVAQQRYLLAKQIGAANPTAGLEQWREQYPKDPRPVVYLGMEAQNNGESQAARGFYEDALAMNPENPLVLNNLAWIHFEAGEEEAVELAKRAVDLAPNNAAILDTYGWILVQRGDAEEGIKWLEKAATAAPESAEIQQHLDDARSSRG